MREKKYYHYQGPVDLETQAPLFYQNPYTQMLAHHILIPPPHRIEHSITPSDPSTYGGLCKGGTQKLKIH